MKSRHWRLRAKDSREGARRLGSSSRVPRSPLTALAHDHAPSSTSLSSPHRPLRHPPRRGHCYPSSCRGHRETQEVGFALQVLVSSDLSSSLLLYSLTSEAFNGQLQHHQGVLQIPDPSTGTHRLRHPGGRGLDFSVCLPSSRRAEGLQVSPSRFM